MKASKEHKPQQSRVIQSNRGGGQCVSTISNSLIQRHIRTIGQEAILRENPISLHKIRNCNANKLLSILLKYVKVHPTYMNAKDGLRDNIDSIREYYQVLPPPMWNTVLQAITNEVKKSTLIYNKPKQEYPYGNADNIPHIHCYQKGAHIKILGNSKIHRYNLVTNNRVVHNIHLEEIKQKIKIFHKAESDKILEVINKIIV